MEKDLSQIFKPFVAEIDFVESGTTWRPIDDNSSLYTDKNHERWLCHRDGRRHSREDFIGRQTSHLATLIVLAESGLVIHG
jgi:hypothetical protein